MEYYIKNSSFPRFNITETDAGQSQTISSRLPTINYHLFEVMVKLKWYTFLVVNPIIGVTGLVGNTLNVIILVKSGLDKSSNILLFALAIADSISLMGSVNVPNLITFFPIHRPDIGLLVWEFSREISFMLYVLTITFQACYFLGLLVSTSVCTLITMERLVAVYFPLHFKTIVTTPRTWMAVTFAFLLWLPYTIYLSVSYEFLYIYYPQIGMTVGDLRLTNQDIILLIEFCFASQFGKFIPLAAVTAGSILIAVRVYVTSRKRRAMVSMTTKTSRQSSRTTTTLLTVCVCFSITKIVSLASFIPDPNDRSINNVVLGLIIGMVVTTADYINSSCNFVIYVALNKKFRALLWALLSSRGKIK